MGRSDPSKPVGSNLVQKAQAAKAACIVTDNEKMSD